MEKQKISPARVFLLLSIIFSVGTILGLLSAAGIISKINLPIAVNPPIAIEENIKNRAGKIMELNNIKEYSLKSVGKNKINLPGQFEISKTILGENFPDFIKYINSDVWQVEFNGEIKELEYNIIFDPNGEYAIAAFRNDKMAEPGIEPLMISFYLPAFANNEAVVGEDFLITLPANPSTGYSWTADFDEDYLILRSKDFVSEKIRLGMVGAGGTEIFTFAPIKAGETIITMNYSRSFDSKPSETKVFKYNIKEKTAMYSNYGEVPDKYSDGSYSVKGFINNAKNLDDASFVLKGMVVNKNECAPCPAGAMCAPCAPPHIFITDYVVKTDDKYSVIVNFGRDQDTVDKLKMGDNIEIYASYNASGDGLTGENVPGSLGFLSFFEEKTAIDFYSCIQNSDCVSIKADCCGCAAGGKATSVNKAYQSEWLDNLDCKDIMCPAVMSGDPSCISKEPKCENNKCALN